LGGRSVNPVFFFNALIFILKTLTIQALAINPQTFSPEILLMVARVVNIDQESDSIISKNTQSIVVRHLQRPGAGAALAFGLNGARFNDEEQVEEEDHDDETVEWTDILTRQWRVIKL
jgi:hypothetical protein